MKIYCIVKSMQSTYTQQQKKKWIIFIFCNQWLRKCVDSHTEKIWIIESKCAQWKK